MKPYPSQYGTALHSLQSNGNMRIILAATDALNAIEPEAHRLSRAARAALDRLRAAMEGGE